MVHHYVSDQSQYVSFCTVYNILELALAISFVSFGSNQTLFLPHLSTAAANRFCNLRVLEKKRTKQVLRQGKHSLQLTCTIVLATCTYWIGTFIHVYCVISLISTIDFSEAIKKICVICRHMKKQYSCHMIVRGYNPTYWFTVIIPYMIQMNVNIKPLTCNIIFFIRLGSMLMITI